MKTIKLILLFLFTFLICSGQDSKISDLSSATQPLNAADIFVVVQSATTKKYTFDNLQEDVFGTDYSTQGGGVTGESIFLGLNSGDSYSAGDQNIGIGEGVMSGGLNSGDNNIGIGINALQTLTTGDQNISIGTGLSLLTTGSQNINIGFNSSSALISGGNNVGVGFGSLVSATGSNNTAVGRSAGKDMVTNVISAFGYRAGESTTGDDNSFFGEDAGRLTVAGAQNSFFGALSGDANTSGNDNTSLGRLSLSANTTQNQNTSLGSQSGQAATAAGCVYIGYSAGSSNATNNLLFIENSSSLTDALIFGDFTGDEVIIDGQASDNGSSRNFYVDGTAGGDGVWNNDSDSTLKKDIKTIDNALSKVMNLRGVTFKWKDNREPGNQIGFLAQEVNNVLPEIVDGEEGYMSMKTASVTAVLVNAVQEQQQQINDLQHYLKGLLFLLMVIIIIGIVIYYKWQRKSNHLLIERGESS